LFDIADLASRIRLLLRTVRTLIRTIHGLASLSNCWNELYRYTLMNCVFRTLNKLIVNIHCLYYAPMDIIMLNNFTEL